VTLLLFDLPWLFALLARLLTGGLSPLMPNLSMDPPTGFELSRRGEVLGCALTSYAYN